MNPFSYERPGSVDDAMRLGSQPGARYVAGGTNLLDLVKAGVETPRLLVDVSRLPLAQVAALPDGGLRIGATVSNTDAANHPLVRERYPLLAQALLSGAPGNCAIWPRWVATCCNAPAATISTTPASRPATSASQARAAARATASTASTPSWARASIASPCIRPTCAWPWPRWRP